MSGEERERKRQFRRRAFHVAIALILVLCAISPFLETAVNWNNTIFATGYDNESTIAILVLLLELVISFAGLVAVYVCCRLPLAERLDARDSCVASESNFRITIPDLSPPPPLRI